MFNPLPVLGAASLLASVADPTLAQSGRSASPPPPITIPIEPVRPSDRQEYRGPPVIVPGPPPPPIYRPQTPPAPDPGLTWATRPQPVYPVAALAADASAIVTLNCLANATGTLSDCRVESETVQNVGFGAAALQSVFGSRLTSRSADSLAGRRVRFRLTFTLPEPPPPPITLPIRPAPRSDRVEYVGPPVIVPGPPPPQSYRPQTSSPPPLQAGMIWANPPVPVYPAAALAADASAVVVLNCLANANGSLNDCRVESETVQNVGFGAAALQSVVGSRLTPRSADSLAGRRVRFRTTFVLPEPPPPITLPIERTPPSDRVEYTGPPVTVTTGPRPYLSDVEWAVLPQPQYPDRASERGLSGTVELQCFANAGGGLTDCSVISESVVGAGFGRAALAAMPASRLVRNPVSRWVRFRLSFSLPD